jgi:hypothetical protein
MTTEFGFCFRPERGREDCSGSLQMWVDHLGVTRFVPTGYDVKYSEWDSVGGTLVMRGASFWRRRRLNRYVKGMSGDMRRLQAIVQTLENTRGRFTAADITEIIKSQAI